MLVLGQLASPLGPMHVAADALSGALAALDWEDGWPRLERLVLRFCPGRDLRPGPVPQAIGDALAAYFDGAVHAPDGLAVASHAGATGFQREVWTQLRRIPAGRTCSYRELAQRLGKSPACARAVGGANAANPVSLVIPCHRLTGSGGGALTGYAGGLERKAWLLEHEARYAP